jgi:hypothetical protein
MDEMSSAAGKNSGELRLRQAPASTGSGFDRLSFDRLGFDRLSFDRLSLRVTTRRQRFSASPTRNFCGRVGLLI